MRLCDDAHAVDRATRTRSYEHRDHQCNLDVPRRGLVHAERQHQQLIVASFALGAHTSGVLGRLFAEALENAPRAPTRALAETGAAPTMAFLYGTLPGVLPQLVSYTLYRWEINIRMAAILGFIGAGGLGQMLYFELSLQHQAQACIAIVAMLGLAAIVDVTSATLRRRLAIA